jgi:hypothetical protein
MIYILWVAIGLATLFTVWKGIEARARSGGNFELDQNPTWSSENVVL